MLDFKEPNIEIVEISEDKKYGRFVVEPLERGYGTTLGNSLRRIMLSSLPGTAVSHIKIDGVVHEFSSIPGVKEDVTEIIMNIKSLAIKNNSDSDEVKTAYIEASGEGVVTAADIQRFSFPLLFFLLRFLSGVRKPTITCRFTKLLISLLISCNNRIPVRILL